MNTLSPIRTGGMARSIVPETLEDVQRIANIGLMAGTFKPSSSDPKKSMAECSMVIMRGLDVGISPSQAMEGIAIINGKTVMYGDLLTAVLLAAGCKIKKWTDGEGDQLVAYATIERPDGQVVEKSYSAREAKQAGLWRENNGGPWGKFPKRMLEWRAFGFAVKDGASDIAKGIAVMEEHAPEYNQTAPINVTPPPPLQMALPDIPDEPEPKAEDDDPQLADQEGFKNSLHEQLCCATQRQDVEEIIAANEALVRRCSKDVRDEINEMFEAALEGAA